jgi:hypothetical protein
MNLPEGTHEILIEEAKQLQISVFLLDNIAYNTTQLFHFVEFIKCLSDVYCLLPLQNTSLIELINMELSLYVQL